jgi:glycosyltransferase involved in cell wall biosynthesis
MKSLNLNKILKYFLRNLLNKIRVWDYIAAQRVNIPIMASNHVAKRLKKYYHRDDYKIIYPSVEIEKFINFNETKKQDYFITIAALTEWKRLDILIKAFNDMPNKKLKIV